jgi:hypothetical protein
MRTLMNRRLVLLAALMVACSDATVAEPPNGAWLPDETWAGRVVIVPDPEDARWPRDPLTIHAAAIKGDSLELTVSFGGGCRDHSFALLGNSAWMESYPVQTGVRLAHAADGDACKALLSRVLRFDLSPLKSAYANSYQTATGIIRLHVAGSNSVTYQG